jgi:hypothetical protein
MCERRKISVFVGGPFNSGILAEGPTPGVCCSAAPEHILERVRRIQSVPIHSALWRMLKNQQLVRADAPSP